MPDRYIKGLNIHSVRDLFLPARVSADLDLTLARQSKKSRLYKKAFLLLAFLEAAEDFTYTFDAHFAKHVKHCAMPLYIMEIETIACKWHVAPKMLCTLKDLKSKFFIFKYFFYGWMNIKFFWNCCNFFSYFFYFFN